MNSQKKKNKIITVSDYVANFLFSKKIKNIFMLTGYGAMYLNDSITSRKIKYYAARNEAAAPMMAKGLSTVTGKVSAVCVTAGPGATNAIPGLAECWVDSSPVIVISGQVDRKDTTRLSKIENLRTLGTAEIDIIPIVKPLTKYCAFVKNPNSIKYVMEKAFHLCTSGRPGPVWIDIPLDVQSSRINLSKLKSFKQKTTLKKNYDDQILKLINKIYKSKSPVIVAGQGVRLSKKIKDFKKIINILKIPVYFSRLGQDIISHNHKYIFGQGGIKGVSSFKKVMNESDLIISFGSRLAVQFLGLKKEAMKNNAEIFMIDIDKNEIKRTNPKNSLIGDLKILLPKIRKNLELTKKKFDFKDWLNNANEIKKNTNYPTIPKNNPMDLYFFMRKLGEKSKKNSVLITDAGSNYYIGGQVWDFDKKQQEVTSGCNAAMGLSIPMAIGASVGLPNKDIFAVTGDGSLELNIQELKTISHYNMNIKIFVINNGGYVSMINWQDNIFSGRRIDTKDITGAGTLNLKRISEAFDLKWYLIDDYKKVDYHLDRINKIKGPLFVEVITSTKQVIHSSFKYGSN